MKVTVSLYRHADTFQVSKEKASSANTLSAALWAACDHISIEVLGSASVDAFSPMRRAMPSGQRRLEVSSRIVFMENLIA